jgi:putative ATP-dependent endonuclease of OLD family
MSYSYISKIEISNFRNFANFTAELPPTSVIVGENRVGKSNLLHALRLVLDPSLADSYRQLRAEDFCDDLNKPFAGTIIQIRISIRGFEDNMGAKSVLADSVTASDPLTASLTYQYRPRNLFHKLREIGQTARF